MYHPRFSPLAIKIWLEAKRTILANNGADYNQKVFVAFRGGATCILAHFKSAFIKFSKDREDAWPYATDLEGWERDKVAASNVRWKQPFAYKFLMAETAKEKSRIAGRYIDSILTTGEV